MTAALRTRELYGTGHFGNTYEVAMHGQMSALLAEARPAAPVPDAQA